VDASPPRAKSKAARRAQDGFAVGAGPDGETSGSIIIVRPSRRICKLAHNFFVIRPASGLHPSAPHSCGCTCSPSNRSGDPNAGGPHLSEGDLLLPAGGPMIAAAVKPPGVVGRPGSSFAISEPVDAFWRRPGNLPGSPARKTHGRRYRETARGRSRAAARLPRDSVCSWLRGQAARVNGQ
jgi:hypothetical protein